jgi:hypothetical protein
LALFQSQVERIADATVGSKDWRKEWAVVEEWLAAHELHLVRELAAALQKRTQKDFQGPTGLLDSIRFDLQRMRGDDYADLYIESLDWPTWSFTKGAGRAAEAAMQLACTQPSDYFLKRFQQERDRPRRRELLACWTHEHILRHGDLEGEPGFDRFWGDRAKDGHPLAVLPLRRLAIEPRLTTMESNRYGWTSPVTLPPIKDSEWQGPQVGVVGAKALPALRERVEMANVVDGWRRESNGAVETAVFQLAPAIDRGALGQALLKRLGLDCLADTHEPAVKARPTTVEQAFLMLYLARCNGGAYGGAGKGAWGRLGAWRSLAAMSGSSATSWEGVVADASRCEWLEFWARPWWEDVAWDLGLAALRPDGQSMAVLAATDTD